MKSNIKALVVILVVLAVTAQSYAAIVNGVVIGTSTDGPASESDAMQPARAERPDVPTAEGLLLGPSQVGIDEVQKCVQIRRYRFHKSLQSHHSVFPSAVTNYGCTQLLR